MISTASASPTGRGTLEADGLPSARADRAQQRAIAGADVEQRTRRRDPAQARGKARAGDREQAIAAAREAARPPAGTSHRRRARARPRPATGMWSRHRTPDIRASPVARGERGRAAPHASHRRWRGARRRGRSRATTRRQRSRRSAHGIRLRWPSARGPRNGRAGTATSIGTTSGRRRAPACLQRARQQRHRGGEPAQMDGQPAFAGGVPEPAGLAVGDQRQPPRRETRSRPARSCCARPEGGDRRAAGGPIPRRRGARPPARSGSASRRASAAGRGRRPRDRRSSARRSRPATSSAERR